MELSRGSAKPFWEMGIGVAFYRLLPLCEETEALGGWFFANLLEELLAENLWWEF